MASDPPLRERRLKRGWAHGFRSSAKGKRMIQGWAYGFRFTAKGKKDDMRLGPWLQILL
jgi:hypothetical protein